METSPGDFIVSRQDPGKRSETLLEGSFRRESLKSFPLEVKGWERWRD
jgi:hypothetical protein